MRQGTVRSSDGVALSFQFSGRGHPLLLVHGTTTDSALWNDVAPLLTDRVRVIALDRRGRNQSGDADRHALELEVDDIEAVLRAIGEPTYVLGHSFGAICALEAARRTTAVDKLVLYEPPLVEEIPPALEAGLAAIEKCVAAGDGEGAVAGFFRGVESLGDDDLAKLRALPSWAARVRAAASIAREMRAVLAYRLAPARFAKLARPTLLLEGAESPGLLKRATRTVGAAIAGSQIVSLPGQRHSAMITAPGMFATALLEFLSR